jgi:prepilin-type N-terminal cleavage/methylation domain-containing protein
MASDVLYLAASLQSSFHHLHLGQIRQPYEYPGLVTSRREDQVAMKTRHSEMQRVGRTAAERGFSLIELLIVVAIILIISAIAIPNLMKAKMAANESAAVS